MMTHQIMLACFYFWLGCCAFGGLRTAVATLDSKNHKFLIVDSTVSLRLLEVIIGSVAWAAAGFNFLTSCCLRSDRYDDVDAEDEEKAALVKSSEDFNNPFGSKQEVS